MFDLSNPIFHDEDAARAHLEALRWPNGATCPFCGKVETVKALPTEGAMGAGWYHCRECRKKFTVRVGTLYERSKIALHKWVLATHLLTASKKGMSAHQLHRMLGITYKSAWFMAHRIRESMREDLPTGGFGSGGGMVEIDETFIGKKTGELSRHGYEHKFKVLSLVDRETGRARSIVVDKLNTKTVQPIVRQNVAREARLMTDEARHYVKIGREYADHQVVHHASGEYGRGNAHTNTIEGFFSIFKRGMKGIYQHCAEKHLHRYTAEFDFRYSNRSISDQERAEIALKGIEGKRLTYRRTGEWATA